MINLLPPKEEERLIEEENWRLVLILGILVLVFLVALTLILFSIEIHILGLVEAQKIMVDSKEGEFSQIQDLEEKLSLINQDLSKLDSFYQGQFNLARFLERISGIIPEGIYLTSLSYRKNSLTADVPPEEKYIAQITLSGFAPAVDALVNFKNNLEKQKDFKEIHFPPAVWIKLVDIDFEVTFKIGP